ncbi:MAG: hypothetical protein AB1762_15945 [Gemmatimonadota bacterium]
MASSVFLVPHRSRWWTIAQYAGVALTLLLLLGLAIRPALWLHVLWDMVIPLLPAVFLLNPMLWRNVCPLATLNSLTGRSIGRRTLDARAARFACGIGLLLLFLLVPARRFLFNTNGIALGATILAVSLLALIGGAIFSRRAGFCNAMCPVLPVEKLYGQNPLVQIGSARCADCSLCTASGCIDLAATKTVAQTMGPRRKDGRWLLTPFGVFAASFPGFIVAFSLLENGALDTAPAVYAQILAFAVVSYLAVAIITGASRLSMSRVMPLLGAAAFFLYYWFGAPVVAAAYGAPTVGVIVIRAGATLLLSVWLARLPRRRGFARTT